ncbi:MAG: GNAT family N-acetyltransferase [Bacteroidales bacterium]
MENIIPKVDKELIKSELTEESFLRHTRKCNNEIYIITAKGAPNTMRELGRLREAAFRHAGGGTGKSIDIDQYDIMEPPCSQLLVWDPDAEEILGGYRYILGEDVRFEKPEIPRIATAHMFNFSQTFIDNYLPHTIELGRSFVTLEYQSSRAGTKGLFALDNLWDGLGALMVKYSQIQYFFGKVTMYPSYSIEGRNMILYFLNKYFPDKDNLVWPENPLKTGIDEEMMRKIFCGNDFKKDYKILNTNIRETGFSIPPLVNAYMGLSPTMKMFGTAVNDEFGNVEETGILITINDIFEDKLNRHVDTYSISDTKSQTI